MNLYRSSLILLILILLGCQSRDIDINGITCPPHEIQRSIDEKYGKCALLLSKFNSLDELKAVVKIKYIDKPRQVLVIHCSGGRLIVAQLVEDDISEGDLKKAKAGGVLDKFKMLFHSPYTVQNRTNLQRIEYLGRRKYRDFGEGDVAFYDLAETMVKNIIEEDRARMTERDLGEKGYLNTFNHITAQAFMTSIFSERFADFVADIHERYHIPELISGDFSDKQIKDLDTGPVDNYIDLVNNEWGQELGKELKIKFNIDRNSKWSPEKLAEYLNAIQDYNSLSFGIAFRPFSPKDELVLRFSDKLNTILHRFESLK